jgi:hypothetical protein
MKQDMAAARRVKFKYSRLFTDKEDRVIREKIPTMMGTKQRYD